MNPTTSCASATSNLPSGHGMLSAAGSNHRRIHAIALVQGLRRFTLRKIAATHPYLRAEVALLESTAPPSTNEFEAEFRNLRDSAARLLER